MRLQACASISVSKLYNFPLQCLGNFVNNLVLSLFPKYLGLPVLTKYFVKIVCLCPEEGLNFRYVTLTLGHFDTYNAYKFTKKAFPESCRLGKYLSFATLVDPITVLGAEQFSFPCYFFFCQTSAKEVLSMSRKPKLVFVETE